MCSRRRSMNGWCPTRLLDLSDPPSSTWKLCVAQDNGVADGAPCQYMTLSYRWARDPTLILTKDTLATFQQGLPISDLPLLFRQVIDVARHFGVRYLWIDALCIVQDWTKDWEREAAMMHKVYTNSVCNVAALAADGPHESLFRDTDRKQIAAGPVETSLFSRKDARKRYAISDLHYYKRQFRGPLSNRGWVMQEKFLAPRVLYFGQHQVLWECLAEKKSEVFPRLQPGRSHVKNITALWDFIGPRPAPGTAAMSDELLAAWTRVLEEYVGCQLTYATDKLFAIAGIAHVFAEVSGDVITAGMWKNRMADQLDWHVKRSLSRPAKFVAPSFSWASVDNTIINFPEPGYKAFVEVVEVTTPPDGQPCFLEVRGRMFAVSETPHHQPDDPPYLLHPLSRSKSEPDPGLAGLSLSMWPVDWDATDDMPPIGAVSVVISSYFDSGDWIVLRAIVLVKSGLNGDRQVYRRVGSVAVDCEDHQFDQLLTVEPTEFTWV
ncbi:heterokaryon incompatibility protein-domain-containing protein [Plectosphaerella cucumerina]|uniref:Heterokaryon incompatibility protein-domain-containing protein n=1 Tax=Plectosphaerella cucumerina TaxID=40658 RepID=A0A8K0TJC0_9PEZI|nr:heterokaryon incompatibility protein-domain-containing protein [Plectosphaerella cucumerina]